jgi:hypothetical protein
VAFTWREAIPPNPEGSAFSVYGWSFLVSHSLPSGIPFCGMRFLAKGDIDCHLGGVELNLVVYLERDSRAVQREFGGIDIAAGDAPSPRPLARATER